MSIIEEIVEKRRRKVKIKGHEMGVKLPSKRTLPVIPFGRDPFIICEIKRSSPSKGVITGGVDAVRQARKYADRGI
ncbi:MAG: bifunctional indole-3-glycerol phosphate synthase/phosphoribosylanthranilate isomerase, partial [Spirochaetes bacterium]|nr:bifunctional indole-3-glycerol phosphate synthase/phosphoribosylanthranilate isomerase [Spirochaetota bacterium]